MMDNRNMLLAIVLSVAILFGFQYYMSIKYPTPEPGTETAQTTPPGAPQGTPQGAPQPGAEGTPAAPAAPGGSAAIPTPGAAEGAAVAAVRSRADALAADPRVRISTPRLHGSVSLRGGRLDDLTLIDYREELDPKSPEIVLLAPLGSDHAYYATFGWSAAGGGVKLPGADTLWTADRERLEPGQPVTLTWDNGDGLVFKRIYAVDKNYMFTVTQQVVNNGAAPVTLYPFGLVSRHGTPEVTRFYILHEGLLGVFDKVLDEVDYKDLKEEGTITKSSTGGWIGITDKYWLTALIPDQAAAIKARFVHQRDNTPDKADKYQTDYLGPGVTIAAGASGQAENHFFAGAKEVNLLDDYAEKLKVANFDLAIDFGWFYWLTKPLFLGLLFLHKYIGNLGISILVLTVLVKLAFFPLANKSYVSMSKMRKLQPEMTKLRERFGDDKVRLNQEMMALYKKEKANPASGCLPILVQIPVFFALYKVLFVTIEMRHAPFFGWIQDLSAPDPTTVFNLFGLIPFTPPDFLMIGIWPLIMGATMFLQQRLNPQPPDPVQAKIFLLMPIMFTFLLARFPAGLVIYWAWNNTLSILQQKVIMMRMGVK
ncbi:MAG: membrane protein insertase YidC [Hyphomicrobiales bacterium]|nr:membrane protein insertase YidC [Hyphomicrobiales bacterium]